MPRDTHFETKVQHKNFEKGEFVLEALRTCDETIALIEHFPWKEERYTPVILTGPSIIIKDMEGRYLKFAHYYDPKYCLYYIDEKKWFYMKIIDTTTESHDIIRSFYDGDLLRDGFIRDKLRFGYMSHLISKNFIYRFNTVRLFWFNFWSIVLIFISTSTLIYENPSHPPTWTVRITIFLLLFVPSALPNLILAINHYNHSKKKVLHISKGSDNFSLINNNLENVYNKNNIAVLRMYATTAVRAPFSDYEIIELIFKDGSSIKFSNLLISSSTLLGKLESVPHEHIKKYYPYIKKGT